jgi:hypothetical protein
MVAGKLARQPAMSWSRCGVRTAQRRLQNDGGTSRFPRQHALPDRQSIQHGEEVGDQRLEGDDRRRVTGPAGAPVVIGHRPPAAAEDLEGRQPEFAAANPAAMRENRPRPGPEGRDQQVGIRRPDEHVAPFGTRRQRPFAPSAAGTYMTGQSLVIDGGVTI